MTVEQTAEQLDTSTGFVQKMIEKGRLTPDAEGRLAASEVEAFGELLSKLRVEGLATVATLSGEPEDD